MGVSGETTGCDTGGGQYGSSGEMIGCGCGGDASVLFVSLTQVPAAAAESAVAAAAESVAAAIRLVVVRFAAADSAAAAAADAAYCSFRKRRTLPQSQTQKHKPASESEDYGGNDSSDTEDREVEDLIRRDQAELNYNYAARVQYPLQPEVEFGFPQTCYCGGRPKLATSRTVNDLGRRYYTCDNVNDGDCHVHKWLDDAVMEEMRARDTHTLQLSEKVDYLTFLNDYDPQRNQFKDL
ncbi:unnamed protein product [Brassica rapa]|uniref:GRF-type domain-containing protein n=1 Tax=Brassica campestris TaxID=3711 RepID=A0A3P6AIN3_BRACM|nr:unnamed protein product [Brassica rapa]VDC84071.1 unnamed protein product [Brassica rapa]